MRKKDRENTPEPSFEPYQFWCAAVMSLGIEEVSKTFKVSHETIRRWKADGVYADRNPSQMENLRVLLKRLVLFGRSDVAVVAINYLSSALDDSEFECGCVRQLLDTLDAEILADFAAVADFQRGVQAGVPVADVEALAKEATAEIERTVAKYRLSEFERKRA